MALKGNKLYPDGIQGIRGFAMAYKDLTTFAIAYKELSLLFLYAMFLFSYAMFC
jgi:hypothetical protein